MSELYCIAIDDEPIALEIIKEFCGRRGGIELDVFSDAALALEQMERRKPDILFLDIELNEANGLNVARAIREDTNIIFTTAYIKYALEGFNLDAADFLHKPFSFERFNEAVDKAKRRIQYNRIMRINKQIIVKQEYSNIPVNLTEIVYIEAMENYSKIYLKNGEMILAHNTLKNLSDNLPAPCFIRIHKSYIVPRKEIKSFSRQRITLTNESSLPVGRQYADILFSKMNGK